MSIIRPIIIGYVADKTGNPVLTLLVTALYLVVGAFFWGLAWAIASGEARAAEKLETSEIGKGLLDSAALKADDAA